MRLVIPNPGGRLKPQMFTNVEITIKLGKRLAVPDEAVIDTGTRKIVYVDKGEGHFRAAGGDDRPARPTECRKSCGTEGRREGGLIRELPDRFGGPAEGSRPAAAQVTTNYADRSPP